MKIAFAKAFSKEEVKASLKLDEDEFFLSGKFKKALPLYRFVGNIGYRLSLPCDMCAQDFFLEDKEEFDVYFSDGIYKQQDKDFKEVIEFYDGFVDFDEIMNSEIIAIKSGYHKCENCKKR